MSEWEARSLAAQLQGADQAGGAAGNPLIPSVLVVVVVVMIGVIIDNMTACLVLQLYSSPIFHLDVAREASNLHIKRIREEYIKRTDDRSDARALCLFCLHRIPRWAGKCIIQ